MNLIIFVSLYKDLYKYINNVLEYQKTLFIDIYRHKKGKKQENKFSRHFKDSKLFQRFI